jgi:hypothetical protein
MTLDPEVKLFFILCVFSFLKYVGLAQSPLAPRLALAFFLVAHAFFAFAYFKVHTSYLSQPYSMHPCH